MTPDRLFSLNVTVRLVSIMTILGFAVIINKDNNMSFLKAIILTLSVFVFILPTLQAQEHTVGLFTYDSASFDGYTLFEPIPSTTTYLIDNYGRLVNSWAGTAQPRLSVYLRENGNLLRSIRVIGSGGETGGGFQEVAWDGTVIWEYHYYGDDHLQHHDIESLPNGNVLVLAWEHKTSAEAFAAGRNPSLLNSDTLSPEHIIEVARNDSVGHEIVWEWHVWDHLIQDFDSTKDNYGNVADHPELIDLNYVKRSVADWLHVNSIAYNSDLDQIVISCRRFDEIWIIDHSTTTAEAAGHSGGNSGMGGDILYRWGNPQCYRVGDDSDKKYFGQHDADWVPDGYPGEGNIMVFSNGQNRPGTIYSSIEEITPPVDSNGHYTIPSAGTPYDPSNPIWTYAADPLTDFYSPNISGCQRLPNGNTLICSGKNGRLFEVTPDNEIVWEYLNPVTGAEPMSQGDALIGGSNSVFKCRRYPADYPGLHGRDLSPGAQVEIYPITISGTKHEPLKPLSTDSAVITTTITGDYDITIAQLYYDTGSGFEVLEMFDDGNYHDNLPGDNKYGAIIPPISSLTSVRYYITVNDAAANLVNDPPLADQITYSYTVALDDFMCGDANGDETLNIFDITYIIAYLYLDGPPPDPVESADVNIDSTINIFDATYMISYLYLDGPPPCGQSDGLPIDCTTY